MRLFILSITFAVLSSCSSHLVTVVPSGKGGDLLYSAQVYIDGSFAGKGETSISLPEGATRKVLVMNYPQYFSREIAIGEWLEEKVVVTLEKDLAFDESFPPKDMTILVNEYVQYEFPGIHIANPAWRSRLRELCEEFDLVLEDFDERSGAMKTEWKERVYPVRSGKQVVTKSRLIGGVVSVKPFRYQLMIQTRRKEPDSEKFINWDRVYKEDAQVLLKFSELDF